MISQDVLDKIRGMLEPLVAEKMLELVGFRVVLHGRTHAIEVFVDRPRGGISLDECAGLNRKMVDTMDAENMFGGDYSLEVSSPGLDWPLKTPGDFLRVSGRAVHFFLEEPVNGKWEHIGDIAGVDGDCVRVSGRTGELAIPFSKIKKAVQYID
ncbi:MAG: ribosome maturation factor RimP [Candidatus Omnitrophota bacterium]|nr:ribosome maturation factor RimP [Candidatus Omnitrophota bacterium]MDZ4242106.1 ribosome maturation factor RimP [Candidatus Omnitrophota bacterium]